MSTKNVTSTQNQYDPQAMGVYNSLQGGLGSTINSYMNNPFSNPFFQTQQQMGNTQANLMGQSSMSNILRNWNASGMSQSNNPALLEMMNNQMRANSSMRANLGFLNPVQNALSMQQNAMGLAANYRPLQTGGTQTQTQSGVGSWLPQLLGGGLSLLTGGLLGGKGGGGGSMGGPDMSGNMMAMAAANQPMQSPFFGTTGPQMPMGEGAPDVGGGYNFGSSPFTMGGPGGY